MHFFLILCKVLCKVFSRPNKNITITQKTPKEVNLNVSFLENSSLFTSVFRMRIRMDSHLIWISWIRIRIRNADPDPGERKMTKINKWTWFPAFQNGFCMFYDIDLHKVNYLCQKLTLCDGKVWQGSGSEFAWIHIGLSPWIQILIKTNGDLQHWFAGWVRSLTSWLLMGGRWRARWPWRSQMSWSTRWREPRAARTQVDHLE